MGNNCSWKKKEEWELTLPDYGLLLSAHNDANVSGMATRVAD